MSAPQWSSQNSPVIRVVDAVPEVHELWRGGTDVELQPLENRDDVVTLVPQRTLHAPGVPGGARRLPLLDRDLRHALAAERRDQVRHPGPVDELTAQQQFGNENRQIAARERRERLRDPPVSGAHHSGTGDFPTGYQPGSFSPDTDRSMRLFIPSDSAPAVIISRNRCETFPKSKKSRCQDHWKSPP